MGGDGLANQRIAGKPLFLQVLLAKNQRSHSTLLARSFIG